MIRARNLNNRTILKEIISKSRTESLPYETQYMIIFAFIYKYCSDSLKDHFMLLLQEREMTLDEAYDNPKCVMEFRSDAYHLNGYYIEKSDAFIDEVINSRFESETFLKDFFDAFVKNVTFRKSPAHENYIAQILEAVREEFPFDFYDSSNEYTKPLKDIIYSISKLNLFETEFSFEDVFSSISDSKLIRANSNPDYIYQILSAILASRNPNLDNVYDPFMRNGSSFLELAEASGIYNNSLYGKESDRVTYCYTIARLFMGYYNMNNIFFLNEDATDSADINQASFDGILSAVPVRIRNYHTSNKKQSLEIVKRHKRAQLEDVLSKNFDMDLSSMAHDAELNRALEKLINRMDVESESKSQFQGEFQILKHSEFLFLINLINSLKDDGVMAISISQNFLTKESLKKLRKYLTVEKNYIDAVINVPNEFSRYKRPEVVMVFRKNRKEEDILFIDMSRNFDTVRSQNPIPGLIRRNVRLADKSIDMMVDVLINRTNVEKYSERVNIWDVASNGFNLSVSMYVDTFEGEFINLSDLKFEKREIDMKREELDYKIDMMMKDLGLR